MKIKPFGVEIWMNEFEDHCEYNLGETCVASLTIEQLLEMSGQERHSDVRLTAMKLNYGAIKVRTGCAITFALSTKNNGAIISSSRMALSELMRWFTKLLWNLAIM